MTQKDNKMIAVAYRMESIDGDEREMLEEATEAQPFQFITGMGITIPDFENAVKQVRLSTSPSPAPTPTASTTS